MIRFYTFRNNGSVWHTTRTHSKTKLDAGIPSVRVIGSKDFNPLAPWGARPALSYHELTARVFQSTCPVGGKTLPHISAGKYRLIISIHLPRGGQDGHLLGRCAVLGQISIHLPRGGQDPKNALALTPYSYFNPLAPWGARPCTHLHVQRPDPFQSTCPVGGKTPGLRWRVPAILFQSTCPVGGKTDGEGLDFIGGVISIHLPRGGQDRELLRGSYSI